jgi:hypothetical protein
MSPRESNVIRLVMLTGARRGLSPPRHAVRSLLFNLKDRARSWGDKFGSAPDPGELTIWIMAVNFDTSWHFGHRCRQKCNCERSLHQTPVWRAGLFPSLPVEISSALNWRLHIDVPCAPALPCPGQVDMTVAVARERQRCRRVA